MEAIIYVVACLAVVGFLLITISNTLRKAKEEKASKDENKALRDLEFKLLNQEILTAEKFQQLEEQTKARIQKDWELAWPLVESKITRIAKPDIIKLLNSGVSTIGVFEAVMNNLNWNELLEGANPQIPPSGRDQINNAITKLIDDTRDELKKK